MKVLIAIFPYLFLASLWSCSNNKKEAQHPIKYDYVLTKYTDISYHKPVDSVYIKDSDTLFFTKEFPIQGFFKIFYYDRSSYAMGELNKNKPIGKWLFYQKHPNKWVLNKEINYDNQGRLHGKLITYDLSTERILSIHQYLYGNEAGIQKDYYPSGKLHIQYEKDSSAAFIHNYIMHSERGSILYKASFGDAGTGYLKFYDKDNLIEWEGNYINKQKQGWHKQYLIDSEDSKIIEEDRFLYKDDSAIAHTKVFHKKEEDVVLKSEIDSISYKPLNNKTQIVYYYNGEVLKKEEVEN